MLKKNRFILIIVTFVRVLDDEETDERTENEIENKLKGSSKEEKEKQLTGRVVGIIRRKFKQYCGILQVSAVPGVSSVF